MGGRRSRRTSAPLIVLAIDPVDHDTNTNNNKSGRNNSNSVVAIYNLGLTFDSSCWALLATSRPTTRERAHTSASTRKQEHGDSIRFERESLKPLEKVKFSTTWKDLYFFHRFHCSLCHVRPPTIPSWIVSPPLDSSRWFVVLYLRDWRIGNEKGNPLCGPES